MNGCTPAEADGFKVEIPPDPPCTRIVFKDDKLPRFRPKECCQVWIILTNISTTQEVEVICAWDRARRHHYVDRFDEVLVRTGD